ncbi:MAG TPA: DPP IV N-terminal domain-containing protein, partial [Vicinamibacterales bacterium]|nr:DPP IV N-terminal domain-containing protein [Vicinamibacterales bacterium]
MRKLVFLLAATAVGAGVRAPLVAQQAPRAAMTAADYARAERFMPYNVTPLVYRSGVRGNWLADDRVWYRVTTDAGSAATIVDPAKGSKAACDLPECAAGQDGRGGRGGQGGGRGNVRTDTPSPDGKRTAYVKDWNLWVRDVASNKETQLTKDGVQDFGYATDNAGWTKSDRAILLWSPDSKRIATFQQDQRKVGDMYLVNTQAGHPKLEAWKYPLPGDESVAMIERVIIDVDTAKVTRLQTGPDQHRSTLCDHIACRGGDWADVYWSPDSTKLAFVSTSRDHRQERLREAEVTTGEVREVLEEHVPTFFESGNGAVNWRYLPSTKEIIWFSERDNWGQLYLYDLATGKLKNQITTGEGNVTQVLRADEKTRIIHFLAVGKEKGRDPYFTHLYRIGFDGKNQQLLTPEDATHDVTLSPSGKYFTDSYSTPEMAPVALLRDATSGATILELEKADISKLAATGWKPPTPIIVKARDGKTDLYGLMFKPTTFDPSKKYPIINHIYPGPQTGSVGGRTFNPARGDSQALAELGFVVVEIDGMGTPWRSKKFHEAYYGNMGDNTLPDQVAGMKELAQKNAWIDLDRAGIWGHSGGGYATADAMFRYPDFFKVGISESGNHDNRVYEDDWAEKWMPLLTKDTTAAYDDQANQTHAKDLKGHLLLAHGTLDNNVPPENTLLVVEALIKANKDFDLLMLPNQRHGYGDAANYMTR